MKIKLIKKLDIKYNLIPGLTRTDRRMLQRGAQIEVSAECGEFLISKGFAVNVDPVEVIASLLKKKAYPLHYGKFDKEKICTKKYRLKSTTKNDDDKSSNNEEAL